MSELAAGAVSFEKQVDRVLVWFNGNHVSITATEHMVLDQIYKKTPNLVTADDILSVLWPTRPEARNLVQKHISTQNKALRQIGLNIEREKIPGKRCVGYRLAVFIKTVEPADETIYTDKIKLLAHHAWNHADVGNIIASARTSIVIIDTFFGDSNDFETLIRRPPGQRLRVSIYMTAMNKPFGAYRVKEMRGDQSVTINPKHMQLHKKYLEQPLSDEDEAARKRLFDGYVEAIDTHLRSRATVKLFTYPSTPSIRAILIDGTQLVFGFFPLFTTNPGFPCFSLNREGLVGVDAEVFEAMEKQIDYIRAISSPYPLSEESGE